MLHHQLHPQASRRRGKEALGNMIDPPVPYQCVMHSTTCTRHPRLRLEVAVTHTSRSRSGAGGTATTSSSLWRHHWSSSTRGEATQPAPVRPSAPESCTAPTTRPRGKCTQTQRPWGHFAKYFKFSVTKNGKLTWESQSPSGSPASCGLLVVTDGHRWTRAVRPRTRCFAGRGDCYLKMPETLSTSPSIPQKTVSSDMLESAIQIPLPTHFSGI